MDHNTTWTDSSMSEMAIIVYFDLDLDAYHTRRRYPNISWHSILAISTPLDSGLGKLGEIAMKADDDQARL